MLNSPLAQSIAAFAALTQGLSDADLGRAWEWRDYKNSGVRFAFFRLYEDLRALAVRLAAERAASQPLTRAQRWLAQGHLAYRDLEALVLGLSDADAQRPPAEGEWPVRMAVYHSFRAQQGFFALLLYALQGQRTADGRPAEMTDEAWIAFWEGDAFAQEKETGPLSALLSFGAALQARLLTELADITDAELDLPVLYWEPTAYPASFRLGRTDSHLREHAVQIEKTLPPLGLAPTEARRLLRHIYAALAEVEGAQIGAPGFGQPACDALAAEVAEYTRTVSAALAPV
jgi:hypothetical protein